MQANSSKLVVILKSSVKVLLLCTSAEGNEVTQKRLALPTAAWKPANKPSSK